MKKYNPLSVRTYARSPPGVFAGYEMPACLKKYHKKSPLSSRTYVAHQRGAFAEGLTWSLLFTGVLASVKAIQNYYLLFTTLIIILLVFLNTFLNKLGSTNFKIDFSKLYFLIALKNFSLS